MGGRGDQEDWVADIPATCICLHDYQWRAPYWGLERYKSFDAAVAAQLTRALERAKESQREAMQKHAALSKAIGRIGKAIKSLKR